MLTRKAGQTVAKGTYWEVGSGRRVDLLEEGMLPGGATDKYFKASAGAMLLMGPLVGLLYVIALPFIALAVVAVQLVRRTAEGLYRAIGKSISFGWRPKNAYLTGKKKEKKKNE